MKISIITICFNNEKDIRATIESVMAQTCKDFEYIIVDGASTDHTLEIVKEYGNRITKVISEPDKGLYDAINKGFRNATGDIVGMIHAGDRLYDETVLQQVKDFFETYNVDISYGHSKIVDGNDVSQRINRSPEYKRSLVRRGWMPSHQSIYCKRDLLEKYGYYRLDCGGGADYEWVVRYFYKYGEKLKIRRLDSYIIKFSLGGQSTRNYKEKFSKHYVDFIHRCWRMNELTPPPFIVTWMFIRKIRQFLTAMINNIQ